MSPKRIPLARRSLTPYLLSVVFCVFLSGTVYGNDSTCIVCHTDEDLLEENPWCSGEKDIGPPSRQRLRWRSGSVGAAGKSSSFRGIP